MQEDYISLETATRQYEAVLQDIRHSKIRTLIELLVASILLLYPRFQNVLFLRTAVVLNALAWIVWCLPSYLYLARSFWRRNYRDSFKAGVSQDRLLEQYERTLYEYRRQKQTAAIVDVLIAFQFVLLAVVMFRAVFLF